MNTALLIIDMQVGLFNDPTYAMINQDTLFTHVNHAIDQAHQKSIPVLAIQHTEKVGLVKDSPDWQLDPRLKVSDRDIVLTKTHSDAFWDTALLETLKDLEIEKLVVAGCQSDFCIDTSVRRAASLGFDVILLTDAHSTTSDGVLEAQAIIDHHNRILCSGFAQGILTQDLVF